MLKPQVTIVTWASVLLLVIIIPFILFVSKNDLHNSKIWEIGEQDAVADIAKGKFVYIILGLPKEGVDDNWAAMLYNNNNIIVEFMGCEIGEDGEYWYGYVNKTIEEIKKRYGNNFFDSTITINREEEKKGKISKYKSPPNLKDLDFCKLIGSTDLALPDSLGGLSCYGNLYATFNVNFNGIIKDIRLSEINLTSDPFSNPVKWNCYLDSIPPNNYLKKLSEWAKSKLKNMKFIVNLKHPLWYLHNTNKTGMEFSINSDINIENSIDIKDDSTRLPNGLIPPKSEISAEAYVWIDKDGQIRAFKIRSIEIQKRIMIGNEEQLVFSSYKDKNESDIPAKPNGDISLLTNYGKYIKQRVYKSTYTVNPNHEYFKYHDVAKQLMFIDLY